jgi:hypothetical protein
VLSNKNVSQIDEDVLLATLGIVYDFKNKSYFKKFVDACVKEDNHIVKMKNLFNDRANLYIDKKGLTNFNELKNIHRIRKQILKLSKSMQQAVIKYHNDECKSLLQDSYVYDYAKERKKFIKEQKLGTEAPFVVDIVIKKWLTHLMDIYSIARILYYIEKGTQKNIVSYTGANHAYSFTNFFKNYITSDIEWEYNSETEKASELRCVYLPLNINKKI